MRHATAFTISLLAALPGAPPRASAVGTAMAARTGGASSADDLLVTVLLLGLAGVAAVALIGTGLLFARRDRDKEPRPTAMAQAAEALERRSVRRSKVRVGNDPIVAALGIHDQGRELQRRARPVREREDASGTPLT
jgi:hypothetical protein